MRALVSFSLLRNFISFNSIESSPFIEFQMQLRLVALNEPLTGNMGGIRRVDSACYRQARQVGLNRLHGVSRQTTSNTFLFFSCSSAVRLKKLNTKIYFFVRLFLGNFQSLFSFACPETWQNCPSSLPWISSRQPKGMSTNITNQHLFILLSSSFSISFVIPFRLGWDVVPDVERSVMS